jgi:lipoprotein-anchoring transpeptidase ErfK/SrfK
LRGGAIAATRQPHHFAVLIPASILLLALLSGCSLFEPGLAAYPADGSVDVKPAQGIQVKATGAGSDIELVEVLANSQPIQAKLDRQGFLTLKGNRALETDTFYEVSVRVNGRDGGLLRRRLTFTTIATPRPIIPAAGLIATQETGAEIHWNIPVKSIKYTIEPAAETKLSYSEDRSTTTITIPDYAQGQVYKLKVVEAIGLNGFKMKGGNPGIEVALATSTPLMADVQPVYGTRDASCSGGVVMTFNDVISNPEAAAALFSVQPGVPGEFVWPEPNQLVFIPTTPWDYKTVVTATLTGGREGLRGKKGGYAEQNITTIFETGVPKKIDVNLATQTLTVLEGGTPIFTTLVSSGKAGYSTPTGEFHVYSKDRVGPMGSAQDAAEFYYISDVPFILWFNGNYSIHGAYWHDEFGNVRSHGCVNVPVEAGEFLYEWAPVGTPVSVHY